MTSLKKRVTDKVISVFTDFKKAFMLFDKDGNGRITADELIDVMTSLGQKPSENEVDAMIRQADQDGKTKFSQGVL